MSIVPLAPIAGVPDALIRDLNARFRALDTASQVTPPIASGTHAARLQLVVAQIAAGAFFAESDRGNALYQMRSVGGAAWVWAGGVMYGTLSPDQRPTGLGTLDTGFQFATTDTFQTYRWSGSAWVEETPGNLAQLAYATSTLTLSTSVADIAGATITLTRAGRHLITGVYDFQITALDLAPNTAVGILVADGTAQTHDAIFAGGAAGDRATVAQQWLYTAAAAGKIVKLQASKTGGTGTSNCNSLHTSIAALWIGA